MKKLFIGTFILLSFLSCNKNNSSNKECNIQKIYIDNAVKVTITDGVWGTVSSIEGNCMPPTQPSICTHCPVKRVVQFYQYTLVVNAVSFNNSTVFFDSFKSLLIAQAVSDDDGFFQLNIPTGTYSVVIIENGKLYANARDGIGGLNPMTFVSGIQKFDLTMTYKATF